MLAEEYKIIEQLWLDRWVELIRRVNQENEWTAPWFENSFADGTPCQDGNPIFSTVCPSRRIGIRVIQYETRGDQNEFKCWTDKVELGEPKPLRELVICCVFTADDMNKAMELIDQWIN